MSKSRHASASRGPRTGRCGGSFVGIATCRKGSCRGRISQAQKKNGPRRGRSSNRQVRQELLILIDGGAEVDADSELEEVEHAPEQERVVARDQRFLGEDRRALGLNLYARHSDCRAAAALPLYFVKERIGRESVRAVDEDPRIAKYGDRESETRVRSDSAKVLGKADGRERDASHVVHANSALARR